MSKPRTAVDDFDEAEFFDDDFDIDGFISSMEGRGSRKRARRSGRRYLEQRREERMLRDELADWDSYDDYV